MRICHNWGPKEIISDQNVKLGGEVSEHCDYYNVIPGKTPPPGGMEDVRITRDENKQDADMQGVRVNCCSETQTIFNQLSFNISLDL